MSDPLFETLPLLDMARKVIPILEYLSVKRQVAKRIARREAMERLRYNMLMAEQMCPLHGMPESADGLALGSPLWCDCQWSRDTIYTSHGSQRVIRVARPDRAEGTFLVATVADEGQPISEQMLCQIRKSFSGS
jgi:hypothetical protein